MAERNLRLDAALQQNLELAAYGRYSSGPRGANAAIDAAESAVSRFDAQGRAAAEEERRKPLLRVEFAFRAMGRNYPAGEYRISPEQAEQLTGWMDRMLAQAKQHDWGTPPGYNETNWPPFTIEGLNPDD